MCPYSEASFKEQRDVVGSMSCQMSCRDLNEMTQVHVCRVKPDRNEDLSKSQKLTQYIIYVCTKTDVFMTHFNFKVGLSDRIFELFMGEVFLQK